MLGQQRKLSKVDQVMNDDSFNTSITLILQQAENEFAQLHEMRAYLWGLEDAAAPQHYIETALFLRELIYNKLHQKIKCKT